MLIWGQDERDGSAMILEPEPAPVEVIGSALALVRWQQRGADVAAGTALHVGFSGALGSAVEVGPRRVRREGATNLPTIFERVLDLPVR